MPDEAALADRVAEAVRESPKVVDLHAGSPVQVATYLPGRRVPGVRLQEDRIDVHVVLEWSDDLLSSAASVRDAVEAATGRPTVVHVEDIRLPDSPADDAEEGVKT